LISFGTPMIMRGKVVREVDGCKRKAWPESVKRKT